MDCDKSYMHIVIPRATTFYTKRYTTTHTHTKLRWNPKKYSSNPQEGEKRETEEN